MVIMQLCFVTYIVEKITGGQMYVEARFNALRETYDLCYAMLEFVQMKCPLLAGWSFPLSHNFLLSTVKIPPQKILNHTKY